MRHRWLLRLALVAITSLVLVQACSKAGTSSTASSTSRSDFDQETRLALVELEVKPDMISNRLNIQKVSLDSGQVTLRLITPSGEVQWEKTLIARADFTDTFILEAIPGIWKLEIELEKATGDYNIQWKASN